jgi:signal peptidase I
MKKNVFGRVLSALCFVCLVILLTFFIVEYVGQYTEVEGMSMYPTLKNKENLILDKVTYRFQDPKRYDIIVFPPQYKENTYYIKRIIGLPGEEVMIRNGEVYIDGKKLKDDCGYEKILEPGLAEEPFVLGETEYFVLGDNRNNSLDSREPEVGNIQRKDIIGRAFFRIWPFSAFGWIQ